VQKWPLQRDCVAFYGDPNSPDFQRKNIVSISTPFQCYYGAHPVAKISIHRKCADAFSQWFETVWENAEKKQYAVNAWGMSSFSGSFVVRNKRAGQSLSMHAFGCAMDFDAARNGFKDHSPNFGVKTIHDAVVAPFKALGGVWGGDWPNNTDGMHFQFAVVG
jgi:hypothetical protein